MGGGEGEEEKHWVKEKGAKERRRKGKRNRMGRDIEEAEKEGVSK